MSLASEGSCEYKTTNNMYQMRMNHDMEFKKMLQTVWPVFYDSWHVLIDSWLQKLPGCLGNVLESFRSFELCSNYEISFQVFGQKLQIGYAASAAFSCMLELGFLVHMYVKHSRSKTSPKIHEFMFWIFDFYHIFFNLFSMQILPNMDDLVLLIGARNL